MNEQLLKDFIATAQKYNYDWNKTFELFPELKGYDQQLLKDYVATAEQDNYDYSIVNPKFPELGFVKKKEQAAQPQPTAQAQPMAQKPQAPAAMASSSGAPSSASPSTEVIGEEFKGFDEEALKRMKASATEAPQMALMRHEKKAEKQRKEDRAQVLAEIETWKDYKEQPYFEGELGNTIRSIPFGLGGFIDDMGRAVGAGATQADLASPANSLMISGPSSSPEQIKKYVEVQKVLDKYGPSEEMVAFTKAIEEDNGGAWGFIKGLIQNPSVVPEVMISSVRALLNPTSAAAAGTVVGGAAAGGSAFGGVGAGPAALASIPWAMSAAGATLETASSFAEFMNEELQKRGLELSEENVKTILEDENALSRMRNRALTRGATVTVFDGFTGRIAGRVGANLGKGAGMASKIKAGLASAGIEAVGGSAGEATARALAGQEMDIAEIGLEGVGEMPMATIDVAAEVLRSPRYKINGEVRNAEDVQSIINTASADELQKINFDIKNDRNGFNQQIQDKIVTNQVRNEIKDASPDIDDESLNQLTTLEMELRKVEGNKTQTGRDKANQIRSQIREVQQAAAEKKAAPAEAPSVAPSEAKPITYDQLSDEAKTMVEREVDLYQSNIDAAKENNREPDERDVSQLELLKSDPVAFLEGVVSFTSNEERKTLAEQALTKIKEEQDAIQKQAAGQVPVQPTARPSEEVAQGEPQAEPQVTAQAGVEEEVSRLEQAFGGAFAETEQMLPASVDATVLEAVPMERKMELTFTQEDGTVSPLNGNEQMASDLYQEAVAIPKAQRTPAQQSVVDMVVSAQTQKPSGVSVSNKAQVAELETKTTDTNKKKIIKAATTAINTLKSIFPDMDIVIHESNDSYTKQVGQSTRGNFAVTRTADGKIVGGRIDINLSKANMRTVAHEVAHAVMLKAFGDNPALFKVFRDRITKILSDTNVEKLNDFASQYEENDSHEEFLVELSAALTEAQEQLTPITVNKIAQLINKVVSKITGGRLQPFGEKIQTNELIDFMNTMSSAIGKGEAIQVKGDIELNTGGEVGTFNIVSKAQIAAPKATDDSRSFIRDLVQDIDIREFNGMPFVTNMYDYTNAGVTDLGNGFSINMMGGKSYVPYIMSLQNKKIGDVSNLSAFNSKENAETFVRNALMGKASLFAPHSGTMSESWQFQQHTFSELVNLVLDKNIMTNEQLINVFNKTIASNADNIRAFDIFNQKYKEEDISNFDSFKSNPKKIVDLLDIQNNFSPDLRKALNNAIAADKTFQKAIGIKNKEQFFERIMDPLNKGVVGGEIISVVKFDPKTLQIVKTDPKSPIDHHPSFGWAVLAKIDGIYQPSEFHKSSSVTKTYTKYNKGGKQVSRKASEPKFEEKNVASSAGAIPKVAKFSTPKKTEGGLTTVSKAQKVGKPVRMKKVNDEFYQFKHKGYDVDIKTFADEDTWYFQVDMKDGMPPEPPDDLYSSRQRAAQAAMMSIDKLTTVSKAQKKEITKFAEDEKGKIRPEQGGNRTGRYSSGSLAPLAGAPNFQGARGPDPELVAVAEKYAQENGIDLKRQAEYVSVDEDRAKRIADAYEKMEHNPNDPKVMEAYADLIAQTKKQYQALADAGYVFSFFDLKTDPYNGNPVDAMRDLRNNKRMAVYGTYDGYGTEGITKQERESNPMLEDTGLRWKDQNGVEHPVMANDLFRAVHDAFGHGLEGAGFRARGEENAWQAHVRLFTGPAVAAITTETRGQNSWLNYGPFGEQNRKAKVEDTVFADNKTGLMPEWTWTEGRAADMPTTIVSKAQVDDVAKRLEGQKVKDDETIRSYGDWKLGQAEYVDSKGVYTDLPDSAATPTEGEYTLKVIPITTTDLYFQKDRSGNLLLSREHWKFDDYDGYQTEQLNTIKKGYDTKSREPIIVETGKDGLHIVVDGHHRLTVAKELGRNSILALVRNYDGKEAYIMGNDNYNTIVSDYIQAKQDGSNPELVKAVEDAIGEPTVATEVKEMGETFTVSKAQKADEEVRKVVKDARAQGYSEAAIKAFLVKKGFTEQEADTLMSKPEAGKKIELGEELMEGYDRMMAEVDGIIEKGLNRGSSQNKIMENVLAYVQGSKAYENATDQQREQIVREVKQAFGEKMKSAPSVGKILGKDVKKVTMTEMSLLKKQLKDLARGARDAKTAISNGTKAVTEMLNKMVKSGSISSAQLKTIIRKFGSLNVLNEKSLNRFIDYMTKVIADADYSSKLENAQSLRKAIKKLSRNKEKNASMRELAKRFVDIDPSLVDDIDAYNDIAQKIKESVKGSTIREGKITQAEMVNIEDSNEYISETMDAQRQKLFDEKAAEIQELLGVDVSDLSYEQLLEMVDKKEKITKYNEGLVRSAIIRMFGTYSSIIEQMFSTSKDPFTGEDIDIDPKKKELVQRFMDMDLNQLTAKQGLEAVDALTNFIQNGSTAKMGAVVSEYTGEKNAMELEEKGVKSEPLKAYKIGAVGRLFAEQFMSLPVMLERMFKGVKRASLFEKMSGLIDLRNKKSAADRKVTDIINDYVDKFYKEKANGEDFNTSYNATERGLVAFMTRNVVGTAKQMAEEFARRKALIEESIEVLSKGNDAEKAKAELYQKAYDKLLKDSKDGDEVRSKADKKNLEAIDYWKNKWAEIYDDLSDVSENVYNTLLDKDLNYTPDRYTRLDSAGERTPLENDQSMFHGNTNTIYKKKTGVLMEAERPKQLPRFEGKKKAGMYVDLSFDRNNANSMYDALVDINTAATIRQVEAFINSESFDSIIDNPKDAKVLKGRIQQFVRNMRDKNIVESDELSKAARSLNVMATIGVGQALGGVFQPFKQTIPVIVNTMINAGKINMSIPFNTAVNDFLNNSGYAIANRGLASSTELSSIEKLAELAESSKGEKIVKALEAANKKMLEILLVKADVAVARASWIAYYEKSLQEQGIDTKGIDYSTHELNNEAADYAQRMVDRQQNISDHDLAGKFFTSKDAVKQVFVKAVMPFASFRINQWMRMTTDLSILKSKTASKEDKRIAARSLAGFTAEMFTFKLVSLGIIMLMGTLTKALMGHDEDDEEEKKRFENAKKGQLTGTITDVFSPLPFADKPIQAGAGWLINKVQDIMGIAEEEKTTIFPPQKSDTIASLGAFGIAAERVMQLIELAGLATNGKFKDDYGNEKQISEQDMEVLKYMFGLAVLSNIGLAPTEANTIVRNSIKFAKKGGKTEKSIKSEQFSPPNGLTKEQFKRYFPEEYEEKYGEGSMYYKMTQPEREQKKKAEDEKQKLMDEYYDYEEKSKKGFGSKGFGEEKKKKEGFGSKGFGSKGFGE